MMKVIASALVVLFVVTCDPLHSQANSSYSQVFLKGTIRAIDAIDAAYKSVLNHDPDAVYVPLQENVQRSLASLRAKASAKREKNFLKLLYSASSVIDMMRSQGNDSGHQFPHEAGIVVQCSTEARLIVDRDSMVGKLPTDFRSNQCLAQMDALVRSIE